MHLQQLPITPSSVEPVDWLIGKLDWGKNLRSWIPTGFESYVRILHPAYFFIGKGFETRDIAVPWASVSQWSKKPLYATSHIQDLMVRADGHDWSKQGEGGSAPNQGQLERTSLSSLLAHLSEATTTPKKIWMLIWFGYGGPTDTVGLPINVSDALTSSVRKYFLRLGEIVSSEEEHQDSPFEHSPSFWWPDDRTWFASCDIDSPSTYVGGTKKLINEILKDPSLETYIANLDDPHGGFYLPNPLAEREHEYVLPRFHLWHFRQRFRLPKGRASYGSAILYRKRKWWELRRKP